MTSIVRNVFIKEEKGSPVVAQTSLNLIERFGIVGDANASKYNPRQVLISSQDTLQKHSLHPGGIKENIVVEGMDVDALSSGSVIQIGSDVQIRITFNCEPCGYLETVRKGLARELRGQRGILGTVVRGGKIQPGDTVVILPVQYEKIPFTVLERFIWLLKQIPRGHVLSYKQIIVSLGLFAVYYRVLPTYLKKLGDAVPIHRIVDSKGKLLEFIPDQEEMLLQEGILIENGIVNLEKYAWDTQDIYYKQTVL